MEIPKAKNSYCRSIPSSESLAKKPMPIFQNDWQNHSLEELLEKDHN